MHFLVDAAIVVRQPEARCHFAWNHLSVVFVVEGRNLFSVEGNLDRRLTLEQLMGCHDANDAAADDGNFCVGFQEVLGQLYGFESSAGR